MVFENEEECIEWIKKVDIEEETTRVIAIMELSEIYQDVHQAIETLGGFSNASKQSWLDLYDKFCMSY